MRRRRFIALAGGGIAALTGCVETGSPGTDPSTTTDERSPGTDARRTTGGRTPTTQDTPPATDATGRVRVTVRDAHLQHGIVTPSSPDSITVSNERTQYLFASVRVDGSLPRDEFALHVGDEAHDPSTVDRLYRVVWGGDRWYEEGRREGLLAFVLRAASGDPRLSWPGGELDLADAVETPVGGPPPRLSASLDLPSTYDGTEAPPVTVEVTNEGEKTGRFLGALNRVGPHSAYTPVGRVSEVVPAGETATTTVSDSWSGLPGADRMGDGEPDVTYNLHHADGEDSADIRLRRS